MFKLKPLPFEVEKFKSLSIKSFELHHGKHHLAYINNLNDLIQDDEENLEKIIKESFEKKDEALYRKIFNNAAQHFNHDFFWNSIFYEELVPSSKMIALIEKSFGSFEKFQDEFYNKGVALFGSGWVWLVYNLDSEKLEIYTTENAITPILTKNLKPILVCDVWEHAYYVDYLNKRVDFLKVIINSFNWEFAQKNLDFNL